MTRGAVLLAGAVGLLLVARAALFYRGIDPLAHGLVLLIGLGLVLGLVELVLRASRVASLSTALSKLSAAPDREEIEASPAPLRTILVARMVGTPAGVGSAVFTPYLLGLLVMIGLLGTFMGLFETLRGAREALTSSGDVLALREGLAAPMKGLSRAFGTSAAGVSASAMLGLAAVFVRRAESRFAGALTALFAGPLFSLTLAGRQIAALEALAESKDALPKAAKAMERATARLESLEEKLVRGQREAGEGTARVFREAAESIRDDVRSGVTQAAESVAPLLDRAVSRAGEVAGAEIRTWSEKLATDADARRAEIRAWSERLAADADARRAEEKTHQAELARIAGESLDILGKSEGERAMALAKKLDTVVLGVTSSLEALAAREEATAALREKRLAETARALEERIGETTASLEARLGDVVRGVEEASRQADARDRDRLAAVADVAARVETQAEAFARSLSAEVERAREADAARDEAARAVLAGVDAKLVDHLSALGERLAGPLAEAARATQAGPEAVARLVSAERDRIEARARADAERDARLDALLVGIDRVSEALARRSEEQAERVLALDGKLELDREATARRIEEKLAAHAEGVSQSLHATADLVRDAVGLVHAGGTEMSAVAEMFTSAVDRYCGASEKWLDSLAVIEAAVAKKGDRDEAADLLGAYLDQTREVFDHSLAFQRELFSELRALRGKRVD